MNVVKRISVFALLLTCVGARAESVEAESEALVRAGDTVVIIGDSITQQACDNPWGFYHVLTNAAPEVNFIPLGFGGYQVKSWSDLERDTLANTNRWTWTRNPGWNLKTVFDGKVDVVVVFLGMNDLLQPSIHDDEADVARWLYDYATFIRNLRARMDPREVVVSTITPLTADAASPKNRMRVKLNNRLRMLAEMMNVHVAPCGERIAEVMRELRTVDSAYRLVPDFVHPNAHGHLILAQTLCATLGLDAAVSVIEDRIEAGVLDILAKNEDVFALHVALDRSCAADAAEFVYDIGYSLTPASDIAPEVRVVLPDGWTAETPLLIGAEGVFRVRGKPSAHVTHVLVEAVVPEWDECTGNFTGARTMRAQADLPAVWRVCDESGVWKAYAANADYTGGAAPGSIDPYQLYFGWKENTLRAYRRVWSGKARSVKGVFSHQTFSATLAVTLAVNGVEVMKGEMDRRGKNRIETTLALNKGWNTLEIVCAHRCWQRQFAFDLEPVDGDDLGDLKYDITLK